MARTCVDDFYGLDPLDRWLNSREGKPRAVLNWYEVFLGPVFLGLFAWFTWQFFAPVSFLVVPVIAAAGAVLAVPLRGLAPALRSRRRSGKIAPEFIWRQMVVTTSFAIGGVIAAFNESIGQSLSHGVRGAFDLLQGVVVFAVLPVLFTTPGYMRRYARARLNRPVGAAALEDSSQHADPPWPPFP
jgi:hypothetical protein